MKKLLAILMLISCQIFAQTNYLTWEVSLDETVAITGLSDAGWEYSLPVTIPSQIEGYPVTMILPDAFAGSSIPEFLLPSTLEEIGTGAFAGCPALLSITIPDGVMWIPDGCFQGALGLTTVSFPAVIISIGEYSFADCGSLGGVGPGTFTIPESVMSIGAGAFTQCTGLYDINIPAGVSIINHDTFYSCGFYNVYLSEGLQEIGEWAFIYSSLTNISFPASLTTIGAGAFEQCGGFGGANLDLKNVTSVGGSAFKYCSFTNAVLTNVTDIPSLLFADCNSLNSITLSPNLERIDFQAFGRCNLSTLTLPSTLNYFDVSSISDTYALQIITFLGDMPETVGLFDEVTAPFAGVYIQPHANGWVNPWANRGITNWFWISDTLIKGE